MSFFQHSERHGRPGQNKGPRSAQALVEYLFILLIMVVVLVTATSEVGDRLGESLSNSAEKVSNASE
jgi:Flp pilus assembly pilin Flp